jgi:coenzyme PQQ synthesis protein D (PqqD)
MRSSASESSGLKPHPDVVVRRVEDRAVLFHLSRGQTFALNETGARFWDLLSEGHGESAALARMLEEFDVAEKELNREVHEFLELLEQEGLVVRADE